MRDRSELIQEKGEELIITLSRGYLGTEDVTLEWVEKFLSELELTPEEMNQIVNAKNIAGNTPLHFAVTKGNKEVAKFLLKNGTDVNAKNIHDKTPLYFAVQKENTELVKLLLEKGADVNIKDKNGNNPLHIAVQNENTELVKLLLEKDINSNMIFGAEGYTVLHWAVLKDDAELVKLLLEKGADVNIKDKNGNNPLHIAFKNSRKEIIEIILGKKDTNVNDVNINGYPPLYMVSSTNFQDEMQDAKIVNLLIKKGAEINMVVNSYGIPGNTALHKAVINGKTEIVKILLENGADINMFDNEGNTSLHYAASKHHNKIVQLLLENGANIDIINENGQKPINIVVSNIQMPGVEMTIENAPIENLLGTAEDIQRLITGNFTGINSADPRGFLINRINTYLTPAQDETENERQERVRSIEVLAGFAMNFFLSDQVLKNQLLACYDKCEVNQVNFANLFNDYFSNFNPEFANNFAAKTQKYLIRQTKQQLENSVKLGKDIEFIKTIKELSSGIIQKIGIDELTEYTKKLAAKVKVRGAAAGVMAVTKTVGKNENNQDVEKEHKIPVEVGLIIGSFLTYNDLCKIASVCKGAANTARLEEKNFLQSLKAALEGITDSKGNRFFDSTNILMQYIAGDKNINTDGASSSNVKANINQQQSSFVEQINNNNSGPSRV